MELQLLKLPIISITSTSTSASASPVGSTVVVPLTKSPQGDRPTLNFQLKLRNKSNRLLLYRLKKNEGEKAPFRARPTEIGVLSPDDVQPIDLSVEPNINRGSTAGFVLAIETAFIEKMETKSQMVVDAARAWQSVEKSKISSLTIPIRFETTTSADTPLPKPFIVSIDVQDELGINWWSPSDVIEKLSYIRRRYPEEFWAVQMLVLLVVVVSFIIGYLIGTNLAKKSR